MATYIIKNNHGGQAEFDEKELRQYAMDFSPDKGKNAFKQDFRLANGARNKPISEVVDMLQQRGVDIEIQ